MSLYKNILIFVLTIVSIISKLNAQNTTLSLTVSTHDITVLVDEQEQFKFELRGKLNEKINLTFIKQHENLIDIIPPKIYLEPDKILNETYEYPIEVYGRNAGHLEVTAKIDSTIYAYTTENVFVRVTIAKSWPVYYTSMVFGWIYFIAWSISFYPQIYYNFRRKSVIGLNFDFLSLNIVGFILYSVFNISLYWIKDIQTEYSNRFPRGLNPVLINDVVFSIHAMFATVITIIQCFIYERAEQRVSITARGILGVFAGVLIIFGGLSGGSVLHWIDFIYVCSYVKLAITLIKYIPQAIMNYKRKSTVGWSIGNIILDFTGGILSMLQMILNAYNYDDWDSIFGDPTKFGLGLFSVCFDIFFMLQHYVFYRDSPKELSESETTTSEDLRNPSSIKKY